MEPTRKDTDARKDLDTRKEEKAKGNEDKAQSLTASAHEPDPDEAKREVKPTDKAVSLLTGGNISIHVAGPNSRISHTYIGVGPLLIPCTRGEQKAVSGDVAVEYFVDNPDPALDDYFMVLLPQNLADLIFAPTEPPATRVQYQKFLDTLAERKASHSAVTTKHSHPSQLSK